MNNHMLRHFEKLLPDIRCPISKELLHFEELPSNEWCVDGLLRSGSGMIYPVIDGVPRLLLESFLDYEYALRQVFPSFEEKKHDLLALFGEKIIAADTRNRRSKKSFSLEWRLLEKDRRLRVWQTDATEFKQQLFSELQLSETLLKGKKIIDIGCGHGRSTSLLAEQATLAIGIDLGQSVVDAAKKNSSDNCFFLQADLHHLPFEPGYFDIVYSSGVIHHTENTAAAFNNICQLTKPGGLLSVWLYKPNKNFLHQLMLGFRKITIQLPLSLQYWLYLIFLVPPHLLVSRLKGHRLHWREIMINHLDMLSPQFRFEHSPQEVTGWFLKNQYSAISVTTSNKIGFSMTGTKVV
jgi:ubiquinone/menaquinone biosynthesis C-methylase UbiE/uncharacterized protein YbaR (Trm112 family)